MGIRPRRDVSESDPDARRGSDLRFMALQEWNFDKCGNFDDFPPALEIIHTTGEPASNFAI